MLRRGNIAGWLLTAAALAAFGVMVPSSTKAQSAVPVYSAVQTTVDSEPNPIRTADLKVSDGEQVQVQPVRWGRGYYGPYRGYYGGGYSAPTYYYGVPYNSYSTSPYTTYYSAPAPYYTYYPNTYYYGGRVAVRPYGRWWW